MKIELVLDARATIGESPTWVAEEAALYWVDIKAPALHRLRPSSGATDSWTLPADIGGFALDGAGRALLALRTGLFWLDLATGAAELAVAAPFDPRLVRFNESGCDSFGRFWIGTMTDPLDHSETKVTGALHSFTSGGGLVPYPDSTLITNGMAWNADETIFYLAHSTDRIVYRYNYDRQTGVIGAKEIFTDFSGCQGIPDGAAVDAEGGYWSAAHGGGCLYRFRPDGSLDLTVELPVSQPTMCCFAGDRLESLYVTSAREKLDAAALAREPGAGGLFRLQPPVAGLARHWRVA